jgi:hypothetical protein
LIDWRLSGDYQEIIMNKIIMLVGLAAGLFVAGVTQAAEVHVMTPCHGATSVQQPSVGATTDGVITQKIPVYERKESKR